MLRYARPAGPWFRRALNRVADRPLSPSSDSDGCRGADGYSQRCERMTYAQARTPSRSRQTGERSIRMRSFLSAIAALVVCAAPAAAQSERPRPAALVNFGYQGQSQDFSQSGTFPLYGETGSFEA